MHWRRKKKKNVLRNVDKTVFLLHRHAHLPHLPIASAHTVRWRSYFLRPAGNRSHMLVLPTQHRRRPLAVTNDTGTGRCAKSSSRAMKVAHSAQAHGRDDQKTDSSSKSHGKGCSRHQRQHTPFPARAAGRLIALLIVTVFVGIKVKKRNL